MSRFKHWFQVDERGESKYGLVIAEFRNVYDWVLAMNEEPRHALGHWNVEESTSIPWREFVTSPWNFINPREYGGEMINYTKTMELYENGIIDNTTLNGINCMEHFKWKEVIPCTLEDRERAEKLAPFAGPIYELNRERPGVPYENIFEMRRDKIINFRREVPNFDSVENYIPIRYEDMVQKGTNELIRSIESKMNVTARCKPSLPKGLSHKAYPKGFVEWVNEHVDWDTEALVGYSKMELNAAKNDDVNVRRGIHLIGERHSGTNWIVSHLEQCFAHSIPVSTVDLVNNLSLFHIVVIMLKILFFFIFILVYVGNSRDVPI